MAALGIPYCRPTTIACAVYIYIPEPGGHFNWQPVYRPILHAQPQIQQLLIASAVLRTRLFPPLVRGRSLARELGAYIHGVPIFVWVPIFAKSLVRTEMGAYIHGVPIFMGCLLSRFYGLCSNTWHYYTSVLCTTSIADNLYHRAS